MLRVTGLSAGYGRTEILREIDFTLEPGRPAALIGPNGTGKSTLLKAIAGLMPHGGTVSLADGSRIADHAAYMPQDTGAASSLTVKEVVLLGRLKHLGLRVAAEDRQIALDTLGMFGLTEFETRTLSALSGGQRQLVFLAQALVRAPRVLLLDEPTAALDLRHQIMVLETVRNIALERGIIVLAAMHDLALAARFCDRMIGLSAGRIAASGAPADVLTDDTLAALYGVTADISSTPSGAIAIVPTGLAERGISIAQP